MQALPTGTVTFLFTDIEGSTKLWDEHPDAMQTMLAWHDALLREIIHDHNGIVFKTIGDAFCAAFATAPDALAAALDAQLALQKLQPAESVPEEQNGGDCPVIRVRMALHTGACELRDNDYFGPSLNRIARLLTVGYGGQTLVSASTQELVRDSLPPDVALQPLGEHRLRDLARPENIFQLRHPALPSRFPLLKSLNNVSLPNNLPQQPNLFIGREKVTEAVRDLLAAHRLLTLTGSGGCGKTRLCLQVAADALEAFPDGVWFVELAAHADGSQVPQAVAQAVGVKEEAERPLMQTLCERLKTKRLLIVMDNCEHLLAACAQLADTLLRNCPQIKVFASSREALGIAGEQTYRIPPLSFPDPRQPHTPESLSQYEAAQLFIDRALLARPGFAVTNQNAPALAQLCHRLDGIPLAIELAAARVRALSLEEINAKLDNRFRLLTGGSRTALPRQQTLRALIDWSYDLLTASEKALLHRLAVFAGGWTLEAASAVAADTEDERETSDLPVFIEEWEILDLLTSLCDKSLCQTEEIAGETRYRLLETVRQYAAERLGTGDEAIHARQRHRTYYLELAVRAQPGGREAAYWLDVMEREHDNLLGALEWELRDGVGTELSLRAGRGLGGFWNTRGHFSEGMLWCERLLKATEALGPTIDRANMLVSAVLLGLNQGDIPKTRRRMEEAMAIYRSCDKPEIVPNALFNQSEVMNQIREFEIARDSVEEGMALAQKFGDPHEWMQGNLATSLFYLGEWDRAEELFRQTLALYREMGRRQWETETLFYLGCVAQARKDFASARALYADSLTLARELRYVQGILFALLGFASLACAEENRERSVQLYGASEAYRLETGFVLTPLRRFEQDIDLAHLREAMGETAFNAAWEAGLRLVETQAVALALET